MQYYSSLFKSDIRIEELDSQLRVWVVQLIENAAYERHAQSIEVRFIHKGAEGFDVIDDGDGLKDAEIESFCRTLPNRERNDMYKTRSIGFMGEAMHSLVRSSQVTVFTRERLSSHSYGWKCQYSHTDASLVTKVKCECPFGTTIEVRKIHMFNPRGSSTFKKFVKQQYELAQMAMTSYSLILKDVSLSCCF
jgi:DNA mismatch repair ATPase MutL